MTYGRFLSCSFYGRKEYRPFNKKVHLYLAMVVLPLWWYPLLCNYVFVTHEKFLSLFCFRNWYDKYCYTNNRIFSTFMRYYANLDLEKFKISDFFFYHLTFPWNINCRFILSKWSLTIIFKLWIRFQLIQYSQYWNFQHSSDLILLRWKIKITFF